MSKWILALALYLTPGWAHAQWFPVNANVSFTPLQVTGAVYNSFAYPLYCRGQVQGLTAHGQYLYSYVDTVVLPGNWAYAYVYTNGYSPFVNAYGNIHCIFY